MNKLKGAAIGLLLGLTVLGVLSLIFWPSDSKALADPFSRFVAWEVSCTSSAISLKPASGFIPRRGFEITNGAAQVFIGGLNVTTGTLGYPVAIGAIKSFDGSPSSLYCVSAGTSTIELIGAD